MSTISTKRTAPAAGESRFGRIRKLVTAAQRLFARQGAVVSTWREYRGRKLGPYYRLAYREEGRQKSVYLGGCEMLAEKVRRLLAKLQAEIRETRFFNRLYKDGRVALRQHKAAWAAQLAPWGLWLQGYEIRGWRFWKIRQSLTKIADGIVRSIGNRLNNALLAFH